MLVDRDVTHAQLSRIAPGATQVPSPDTRGETEARGVGQGDVKGSTGYNPFDLAKLNKGSRALIVFSKSIRAEIIREFNKR